MKYGEAMGNAECKREYHESKGSMEGGKFKLGKTLKKLTQKSKMLLFQNKQDNI